MRKTPTVSLCMIVKNEEKYLEKCLTSVKDIVDEIIIVDTGSTDATMEIAKKYGANIYQHVWNNDFSEARNYSIKYATKDYILILDADECMEIDNNLLDELKEQKDYYITKIKNFSSAGFIRYHEAIRVFKNNIGLEYYGKIHEHLTIEKANWSYTQGYSSFVIRHEGYREEVVVERNKKQRNLSLLLQEISENPTGYNYFNLAKQYKQMNKIDEALDCFKKSFNLSKSSNYKNELLFHIIDCLRQQKRYFEALSVSEDAISLYPEYTDIHFIRGRIFLELEYLDQAEESFRTCLNIGEVRDSSTTEGVGSYWSYYYLSKVLIQQGNKAGALETLMFALKAKQGFYLAFENYVELMTEVNIETKEIFDILSKVHKITTKEDLLKTVQSIYFLRNPLLFMYVKEFNLKLDNNIMAVAYLYGREYNQALEIWNEQNEIPEENKIDALLLSIFLKNEMLVGKINSNNLSYEETLFYSLLAKQDITKIDNISSDNEKVFLQISERLLILKEYETFLEISKLVPLLSISGKFNLSKMLNKYGFYKQAAELLLEIMDEEPENINAMEVLGDIFYANDNFDQTLIYYSSVINVKESYRLYWKLFKLYQKFNKVEASSIQSYINTLYPYSKSNLKVENTI